MADRKCKLAVCYTNDVHSHFEHMPKIATVMNEIRKRHGSDATLTIDIGDHMDRMRIETEGSVGRANIDVLNASGYDAVTIGNNEGLTFLPEQLANQYRRFAKFSVLTANVTETNSGRIPDGFAPYTIMHKGELAVGLIGVTIDFNSFYNMLGWTITDPVETVARIVRQLRPQVDLLFVLSHLGLNRDQQMAKAIPGIDCIFGGHTHHLLEQPLVESGTYICAAGKFGEYTGEIVFDYDMSNGRIVQVEGTLHDISETSDDPEIVQVIRRHKERSEAVLGRPIAELKETLTADWKRESILGNVLADGLRRVTGSDIAIVNAGQIVGDLLPGPVTLRHLLEVCPSPINPCRMKLNGSQIMSALEQSLLPEYTNMPIRGFGFRGKVLGTLCVSGMEVDYDPNRPDLNKILSVHVNGEPLHADQLYTVGTIDMFTFGIGYLSLEQGKDIHFYMPEFIRDVLKDELIGLQQSRKRCKTTRWRVSGQA